MVHSTLYTFSLSNGHNEIQLTHSLQNCVGITLLGYESVSKNILVHFEDLPISAECYFDNVIHTRTIYLPNSRLYLSLALFNGVLTTPKCSPTFSGATSQMRMPQEHP